MQFTEQVVRFRDYMPGEDRGTFLRLVDRIAADPEGAGSHLAYTTDTVFIELDVRDAARGFNEV
ncbi:hypothetical protein EF903_09780 [Streptomyces sp. WAC05292]|uniref:hypothetical protein n=1 Tax=Streptomyces sp. WAC05292 TaxID=2487418 RepID=UPI000F749ECF|nr:hypothetical protein [Streptomyces sp. WAC05292]RSS92341.1 hypothetical protein EF903_09780 [Streptomyces sp. WAC05292]